MFNSQPKLRNYSRLWSLMFVLVLSWTLISCSDRLVASPSPTFSLPTEPITVGKLAEVPIPPLIQELRRSLDQYQPQVKILSPQPEQILEDTTVSIKLSIQDLTIFQNPDLEMGPHLHLILDNEPYQAVYNVDKPIILNNLTPGTHSLRVFASRPWHESFKNDGAFAQTTFHVLTKTEDNRPNPKLPLLTYSRPKGSYGAEPILLDFYLTNAPLHVIAQENPKDAIADWRIRVTINGESFILDSWQPIYLTGFDKGKNWIKLEFIDEQGNLVANVFNNTVRVIDYNPNGQDTLSKLVRGDLSLETAKNIINPDLPVESVPTESEPSKSSEIESSDAIENKKESDQIPSITPIPQKSAPLTPEILNPQTDIPLSPNPVFDNQPKSEPILSPQTNSSSIPEISVENSALTKGKTTLSESEITSPVVASIMPEIKDSPSIKIPSQLEVTSNNT